MKTDNRNDVYVRGKENLEKCLQVINLVADNNYTESSACRKCNVDLSAFRRMIRYNISADPLNKEIINNRNSFYNWKDEFLYDVFDGSEDRYVDVYNDFDETFEYVMSTLTDKEAEVIKYRYIEYLTFDDISKKLSVTRERVRQIYIKAMRKLRNYKRINYFRYGKANADTLELMMIERIAIELKNKEDNDLDIKNMLDIANLGLSRRLENVLIRKGISNLEDITEKTEEEMLRCRNMGIISMKELKDIMNKYGVEFKKC